MTVLLLGGYAVAAGAGVLDPWDPAGLAVAAGLLAAAVGLCVGVLGLFIRPWCCCCCGRGPWGRRCIILRLAP